MSELKPCPFCGPKEETYQPYVDSSEGYYYVACGWCEIKISEEKSLDKAISVWNTRASPWIPCKDRLPEDQQDVIFFWSYDYEEKADTHGFSMGFYEDNYGFYDKADDEHCQLPLVKAWMPMLVPPDKDEA